MASAKQPNAQLAADTAILTQAKSLLAQIKANVFIVKTATKTPTKLADGTSGNRAQNGAEAGHPNGTPAAIQLAAAIGTQINRPAGKSASQNGNQLPKTGDETNAAFAAAGLGILAALGSLVGFKRRRA